ncbi:MAG: hypothetical protein HYW26_05730 [Candidatus Aenigmarchaeota archaeon]|nr:hypothetical protein [Candidatus Aenigmarchaeota archaeon]
MPYTFLPKQPHAKAHGRNMRISRKSAVVLCAAIRNKPLTRARRLLTDIKSGRRSLKGKYYSKTVDGILELLNSCEKNAGNLGLDSERLFVQAAAHQGTAMRRRRRKSGFGSHLKATHLEIFLVERGKVNEEKTKEKMKKAVTEAVKKEVQKMKEKEKEISAAAAHEEKSAEESEAEKKIKKDFAAAERKGIDEEIKEMKDKEREIEGRADEAKAKKRTN